MVENHTQQNPHKSPDKGPSASGAPPAKSLEKLLSIFSDVRAGESASALFLMIAVFLLLAAYYLLKPVREALILTESGAEMKAYSAAGQAVLLFGIIPLYGWIASKINRIRLLTGLTLFFVLNLIAFWFFGTRGLREGVAFYIWLGIFNIFMVSQYWAFANDIYTEEQGKRLFPLIGIGMSVGAWVGASMVSPLMAKYELGPYALMLVAAGILLVCLGLILTVHAREVRMAPPEIARQSEKPLGKEGGFQLILKDKYLFWIAILIVILNVVNTTGEYLLGKVVLAEAQRIGGDSKEYIGQFYGHFYSIVNLLGFLLQALATSRVIRLIGVRGALFVLPVLALLSYSALALAPVLMIVRWTKVLENSTDYSIMNTVRQALWLPTTREAKYKAKAAIDTFFTRSGDVLQAVIVFVGTSIGMSIMGFAWLNVGLTVAWLFAATRIYAEHRRRTAE